MSDTSLPADMLSRITDAIESIQRNVTALQERQDLSREAYKADRNRDLRDAVERKFEKLAKRFSTSQIKFASTNVGCRPRIEKNGFVH